MSQTIPKLLFCIPFLALAACIDNDKFGRPAKLCADAVRIYRGLPNPVEITSEPQQTTDGVVEIRFQSMSAEHTPVTGVATCEFSVGSDGSLTLDAASLDQGPVPETDLAAINRELGEG